MKSLKICCELGFAGLIGMFVVGCATPPPTALYSPEPPAMAQFDGLSNRAEAGAESSPNIATTPEAQKRTGIATGWGREVKSAMTYGRFVRSGDKPSVLSQIRYNDREGAEAMGVSRWSGMDSMQQVGNGWLEWGMSSRGRMLPNYLWRGDRFVVGKEGREYEIEVRNTSDARLEVVLSVDGLDVMDGQPASTRKRGYLIEPGKKLVVRGFRTSTEKVATFKFSSVAGSYANLRHGNPRNVGVIGLAVFSEKGREPGTEARTRGEARPFAEAPPVRGR